MCKFCDFVIMTFALSIAEVTPWTIDLPEARKYLFEKNDNLEKLRNVEHKNTEINEQIYLSNRYDSNSKHHDLTEMREHDDSYAKEYGYQSYTEDKVREVVYAGSRYMAGLQLSIERFSQLLENCSVTRLNQFNGTTPLNSTRPWRPVTDMNETFASERERVNVPFANDREQCRRATSASEHVRRLAALAVHAAKELQDIAYSRKHMKEDPQELTKQENEGVLKLAWTLDRLARLTGYQPQPSASPDSHPPLTSTAPPVAPSLLNAPPETTRLMMNCLKSRSSLAAPLRCAYPHELPQAVVFILNNSNPVPGGVPSPSNQDERVLPPSATSEQELLIADSDRLSHRLTAVTHDSRHLDKREVDVNHDTRHLDKREVDVNHDTRHLDKREVDGNHDTRHLDKREVDVKHDTRHLDKREVDVNHDTRHLDKREVDVNHDTRHLDKREVDEDTAITFMKYFIKHKIWNSLNQLNHISNEFDVSNEIHSVHKRSTDDDLKGKIKDKKGLLQVGNDTEQKTDLDKITVNEKTRILKLFRGKLGKIIQKRSTNEVRKDKIKHKKGLQHLGNDTKPKNINHDEIKTNSRENIRIYKLFRGKLAKIQKRGTNELRKDKIKHKKGLQHLGSDTKPKNINHDEIMTTTKENTRIYKLFRGKLGNIQKRGTNELRKDKIKNEKVLHDDAKPNNDKTKRFIEETKRIDKIMMETKEKKGIYKLFRGKHYKTYRAKRSYTYEKVTKPRIPDDLYKDISYYTKTKSGTYFNRDSVQAVQVRAGLTRVLLNPNIETVRRYGSNYNPLIPDPLMFSALRSAADN